jgi:hypothetical protein
MTPARIRELRRAGVLDGSRADAARIALLDLYEMARSHERWRAPHHDVLAAEIRCDLDPAAADTPQGRALRWARARARARRRTR